MRCCRALILLVSFKLHGHCLNSEVKVDSVEGDINCGKRPLEVDTAATPTSQRPRLNSSKDTRSDTKTPRLDNRSRKRWLVHRIVEDSANFSGDLLYPKGNFETFGYDTVQGTYPLGRISTLGYLINPLRRPAVAEKWSPGEIALFEASMMTCGKRFYEVQRYVKTKTVKEVIEYYYFWKKTQHYKQWKSQFIPDPKTHPHLVALGDHLQAKSEDDALSPSHDLQLLELKDTEESS